MDERLESVQEAAEPLIREFVEHWGLMARSWGINPTMGELFALLYVTGEDWTAEALRDHLKVSRGNVSMNLRELINWGVVHKVHRQGERKEYFRAEADVWILFRRIVHERKRRELDPTVDVLARIGRRIDLSGRTSAQGDRIEKLQQFFGLVQALVERLDSFEAQDVALFSRLLRDDRNHLPTDGAV